MTALIRVTRRWTHNGESRTGECYVNPSHVVSIRPTTVHHDHRDVSSSDVALVNGQRWTLLITPDDLARLVIQAVSGE